ncbi:MULTISPECIES: membrane protein insertion efficiency factor YidD [unclassified Helicobacter]|uniref:membrane protein insertion efficiency factor YidD n=1 Tax=unclassified Helicobacter TaxID=2593540 RepID=UPI000CF0FC1C|nr:MULTISPECIES: membrane protein insertion efficiency factor YidD [unclassified Helicobacter]
MKKISVYLIFFYQKLISPVFMPSCRYYPTCSNYALWCFSTQGFFSASWSVFKRILRCNQLFKGGIDYPIIKTRFKINHYKPCRIKFWFVPIARNSKKFYIIKAI